MTEAVDPTKPAVLAIWPLQKRFLNLRPAARARRSHSRGGSHRHVHIISTAHQASWVAQGSRHSQCPRGAPCLHTHHRDKTSPGSRLLQHQHSGLNVSPLRAVLGVAGYLAAPTALTHIASTIPLAVLTTKMCQDMARGPLGANAPHGAR